MTHNTSIVTLKNQNLDEMTDDFLYHLGIKASRHDNEIHKNFGDVRFVCMGGTKVRMAELAKYLRSVLKIDEDKELVDLCEHAHRYAVYKVGPVLCCSHGIGMSTMSVILHELLKLVKYARCIDPVFIRIGTCGGLGLKPGTVVVSKLAYNGYLNNEYEIAILGERVKRPARFDESLMKDILECGEKDDDFDTVSGNTMGTDCFYEGQGRLDGASCAYTDAEKLAFLSRCLNEFNIRNIEMEAPMFSSLCLHVGVKAADVCVTLLNRLQGDQIQITMEEKHVFEERPIKIIGRYIKRSINLE